MLTSGVSRTGHGDTTSCSAPVRRCPDECCGDILSPEGWGLPTVPSVCSMLRQSGTRWASDPHAVLPATAAQRDTVPKTGPRASSCCAGVPRGPGSAGTWPDARIQERQAGGSWRSVRWTRTESSVDPRAVASVSRPVQSGRPREAACPVLALATAAVSFGVLQGDGPDRRRGVTCIWREAPRGVGSGSQSWDVPGRVCALGMGARGVARGRPSGWACTWTVAGGPGACRAGAWA